MPTWTVPGYADIRELGHNGSGRTALSRHCATGVPVAIRYLAGEFFADQDYLDHYRAQARLLADLSSPHLAQLYEYVESGDGAATVREYVDGVSLRQLLAASDLPPEAALGVLNAGLSGLAAAHGRGATHGGYKPENILIDRRGHARLADFGAGATGSPTDDTARAVATFVESVTGSTGMGAAERLPKRLRPLVGTATAGDATALLADLEACARAAYGDGWQARARLRLADRVDRLVRRDRTRR